MYQRETKVNIHRVLAQLGRDSRWLGGEGVPGWASASREALKGVRISEA